ncbi:CHAT domain-containing WD40 repeat protein [Streptomyces niger]|uniref:CHAT domain-containing WD40 repeat protein n=1 Tax=Streptomyces niger TaxID=66373 RepID=UPI00069A76BC|nr:CHAT domain-containing protein [Streptomyces niger]
MPGSCDFVVEISNSAGRYAVDVASPAGEDSVHVTLDAEQISAGLAELQAVVLASSATPRAAALGLERPVRDLGEHLFRTVFGGQLRGLFLSSRQRAGALNETLRLVLRIRAPELAALPWELLYDKELGGYLSMREPVVRYVDMPEPTAPLRAGLPLRILGMTSLPGTQAPLDADSERAGLEVALRSLIEQGRVRLDWVAGQTTDDLRRRLLRGCDILHFIGHGAYDPHRQEGMIALADEDGREHLLHASALAPLISVAHPRPQLVVLNSCQSGMGNSHDLFSSTAATLVRTVPAVVAMQFAVTDKAATRFAAAFYQALAFGRAVDEAVRVGRVALIAGKDDSLEWATPVLYLRSGDAGLFEVPATEEDDVEDDGGGAPPRAPDGPPPGPAPPTAAPMRARVLNTGQWVQCVAFHPDGRRLAAGSRKWVRVWDAQTGNRVWEQAVSWLSTVFAAEFGPDGRRLATGSADNTARVWATADGEELLCVRHDHIVFGVAFSPDGHRLATASADRTVRVWDAATGEPLLRLPHDQVVSDVAYSPDGQLLATACADRSVRVWTASGDPLLRLRHQHPVKAVCFAADGHRLAACGDDGTARVWDARHGHQLLLVRHGGQVKDVAFSPDGRWIATASTDRTAEVWDAAGGERVLRVRHGHFVFGVAFSPDSRWLASAGEDKTIKLTPVPPHGPPAAPPPG